MIVGRHQASVIGTLVERQTRTVRLLHFPRRDSNALHGALVARLADLPPGLLRSITWDQGSEMARHLTITASIGAPVYLCDSHSPWQRGSNENTNGVLRDYFPKGTDLNRRQRLVLDNRSPAELLRRTASVTKSVRVATLGSSSTAWRRSGRWMLKT